MNAELALIVGAIILLWTVLVLGLLVGMSVHRENTRRQRRHLERERAELERTRARMEDERRLLGL